MYFWTFEIESVSDSNVITFKNGKTLQVTEKNKSLFTEKALNWSELQQKWVSLICNDFLPILWKMDYFGKDKSEQDKRRKEILVEIIDMFHAHNVRFYDVNSAITIIMSEIQGIFQSVQNTISEKQDDNLVNAIGRNNLASLAEVFGVSSDTSTQTSIASMSIQFRDIFKN